MTIPFSDARDYLARNHDRNLPLLGALDYEPVQELFGLRQRQQVRAVAVLLEPSWGPAEPQQTVWAAADTPDDLAALLAQHDWPRPAIWSTTEAVLLPVLEEALGQSADRGRGQLYLVAQSPTVWPHSDVRQVTLNDVNTLDLSPCGLSAIALRNWLRRGWRVFGAVREGRLLCHALAAYPIGDTEEVAAVFTAPAARRQGLATAVVAATASDIVARGLRPIYSVKKANVASMRVALTLDFVPLLETWELVHG